MSYQMLAKKIQLKMFTVSMHRIQNAVIKITDKLSVITPSKNVLTNEQMPLDTYCRYTVHDVTDLLPESIIVKIGFY